MLALRRTIINGHMMARYASNVGSSVPNFNKNKAELEIQKWLQHNNKSTDNTTPKDTQSVKDTESLNKLKIEHMKKIILEKYSDDMLLKMYDELPNNKKIM